MAGQAHGGPSACRRIGGSVFVRYVDYHFFLYHSLHHLCAKEKPGGKGGCYSQWFFCHFCYRHLRCISLYPYWFAVGIPGGIYIKWRLLNLSRSRSACAASNLEIFICQLHWRYP